MCEVVSRRREGRKERMVCMRSSWGRRSTFLHTCHSPTRASPCSALPANLSSFHSPGWLVSSKYISIYIYMSPNHSFILHHHILLPSPSPPPAGSMAFFPPYLLLLILPFLLALASSSSSRLSHADYSDLFPNGTGVARSTFPPHFLFGAITSSMKHEGAETSDGKSLNIWDHYAKFVSGATLDGITPGESGNNYFQYKEDHQLLVDLGMNAYRMSLAWSRIYPQGSGEVNLAAIDHYNDVINDAIDQGLELFVTLWTQDHPHVLDNTYGGPLNATFIEDFANYANTCFSAFGDRVKNWITFDEPNDWAGLGYATNQNPPGRCTSGITGYGECWEGDSGTEPYVVGHHVLLAHAEAVNIYRTYYQDTQNGTIGIALWTRWFEPLNETSEDDIAAAQRAQDFLLGWFLDPILKGDYPNSMKEYAGSRLPSFTSDEIAKVNGSIDFLGLNIVTAFYVYNYDFYATDYPLIRSYYLDPQAAFTGERDGVAIGVGDHDYAVPWCIKSLVAYIKDKYDNYPMYISQTGWGIEVDSEDDDNNLNDDQRVEYFATYYEQLSQAITDGANVKGAFAWSLIDGFEFNLGMQIRVGIHYLDDEFNRYQKKSALWFKAMLADNSTVSRSYS